MGYKFGWLLWRVLLSFLLILFIKYVHVHVHIYVPMYICGFYMCMYEYSYVDYIVSHVHIEKNKNRLGKNHLTITRYYFLHVII